MVDVVFAILMILACIKGYQKGLIIALFSIVAFIIGLAAALKFSSVVAGWLGENAKVSAQWLPFLSFAIVFLAVVLLVNWGGKIIEKTFQMALLGWVNRLGGIIFYAVLYIIIFSVFLFYAENIHLIKPEAIQASQTYSFVQPWGPVVINNFAKVIPVFKDMFADLETFFGTISNKMQH
ncbi:CvpA family protein [Ferruginibacter sp. SUN106]|uniref:CvpA family protein n=1 Tax=Ferruginibacter sp. SUN106 TaxID=2978348 RepID=UPI003D36C581